MRALWRRQPTATKAVLVGGFVIAFAVLLCGVTATLAQPAPSRQFVHLEPSVSATPAELVATPSESPSDSPSPSPSASSTTSPPAPVETTSAERVPVEQPTRPDAEVYYPNCAAARAAGAAPIMRGEPGYRPGLDRDHDGVACE